MFKKFEHFSLSGLKENEVINDKMLFIIQIIANREDPYQTAS